ncbi:hypothetical protein [Amycolatopsis anabasis]|uniref:hypothetical protein n=1 Tax=Amycolatopsis anabasis TaxID=1840409 RepID=UPI00131CDEB6|nr:hypothetical protein [Amycolatopsis anabasis]
MTELEALRNALRESPLESFPALDAEPIMAAGRRIRRRRRVRAAAGVGSVVAAVALVATGVTWLGGASAPRNVAVQPPAPTASRENNVPLGGVIATGLHDPAGERVLYAVRIAAPELPQTTFGVMAGHRTAAGNLTADLLVNESRSPDRRPGFHALDGGEQINGQYVPVFGYYAGPAKRIASTVHGRTVYANLAPWSEDPNVWIFWFTPADVPSNDVLTPPVAYSADGGKLPS